MSLSVSSHHLTKRVSNNVHALSISNIEVSSVGRVPGAFYRVRTFDGVRGYYPLYGARGEALWQKMV